MPDFHYQPLFEHAHDETPYRRLDEASKHVEVVQEGDRRVVRVGAEGEQDFHGRGVAGHVAGEVAKDRAGGDEAHALIGRAVAVAACCAHQCHCEQE